MTVLVFFRQIICWWRRRRRCNVYIYNMAPLAFYFVKVFPLFRYWTSILHTRHSWAMSTNSYVLLYLVCYLKGTLGAHQCLSYTLYITLKFLFNFVYTGNPSPSTEVPYCKVLTLLILTYTYGTQKCRSTWSIWATWTWFGIKTLKIGSVNANEVKYSFLKSYMNRSSLKDNFIF